MSSEQPTSKNEPASSLLTGVGAAGESLADDGGDHCEYRLLIDQSTDMLCRLTPQGFFLHVSAASLKVLGYEPEELIGRSKAELIHPEDRAALPAAIGGTGGQADLPLGEYRLRRKDDRYIWAQTSVLIVRDDQGRPRQVIASVRDITERKHAQDNLRHSERLASLGTLAAGIAHEINNPLGAILMAAHAAREFNKQDGKREMVDQMLEQIMVDTRRGSQIVRSVLQFARREPADRKAARLRDLMLGARVHALRYAAGKAVEIKVRGPDESPWVLVGAMEIEQALVNLLHNAIDAQASRIQVQVRPMPGTERVSVQVIDNGHGMTGEQVARAFDPFYTGRPNTGGIGLGLCIAQGIVLAHGGKMALASAQGRGATVTFDLPRISPPQFRGVEKEDAQGLDR